MDFFNIIGALLPLRLPLTNSWNAGLCYHRSQISLKFGVVFNFMVLTHPPLGWMKYANSNDQPLIMDGVAIVGGNVKQTH